jgi:hypothetical protein
VNKRKKRIIVVIRLLLLLLLLLLLFVDSSGWSLLQLRDRVFYVRSRSSSSLYRIGTTSIELNGSNHDSFLLFFKSEIVLRIFISCHVARSGSWQLGVPSVPPFLILGTVTTYFREALIAESKRTLGSWGES